MRLRHIEVFQAVMETGSMSAAGRLIHLTQSAVSRLIASAELQLGYPLFHRVSGRLIPTEEGLALFAQSSDLFERMEAFRHMARHLKRGNQGTLRIGAIPSICHKLVPDAITAFQAKYPEVVCQVHTAHKRQLANELLTRDIDIGLDFFGMSHPGIEAKTLGSGPLYVMWSNRIARSGKLALSSFSDMRQILLGMPMVALLDDDPVMMSFSRHCELQGISPHIRMQVQTSQLAEELVARGCGWTVVDFLTAAQCSDAVKVWPLQPAVDCTVNALALKSVSPTLLARKFLDEVKKIVLRRQGK